MKNLEIMKRIKEAFCDVDFENFAEVDDAAEELKDVDPKEVLDWISEKLENEWSWDEVINYGGGVQNIEKVFGATFDIEVLINSYFGDGDHWNSSDSPDYWIKEFNQLTGKGITINDVIEHIDMDFLVESHSYGPGLNGFIEFVENNNGDMKMFIKRLAPEVCRLSHEGVEDIIYCLDSCIEDGDLDMNEIFSHIEWVTLYEEQVNDYVKFFEHHAPELVSKIPVA